MNRASMNTVACLTTLTIMAGCTGTAPGTGGTAHTPPGCVDGTLGLDAKAPSREVRARLGLSPLAKGALVDYVYPGGPAARAGILAGDVLTAVGDRVIATDCDVAQAGYGRTCDPVRVTVWRDATERTLQVTPANASFYAELCESGNARACFTQGWLVWSRGETRRDRARALRSFDVACRDGLATACAYQGLLFAEDGAARAGEALVLLERACDLGDAAGCAHLAHSYVTGELVGKDEAKATALYVKSCDLGDPIGCFNVGLDYEMGRGVAIDLGRASAAYEEGCAGGSSRACTNLGYLYQNAKGVQTQLEHMVELYRRGCEGSACEGPNLLGCVNLGRVYRDGIGVTRDPARAMDLFTRVCEGRIQTSEEAPDQRAQACGLIGAMHLAGSAPAADAATGRRFAERACQAGDPSGCFNAGRAYETGLGGTADDVRATHFYRRGCDVDDAESCYELGTRYQRGIGGTTRDTERARALMEKACAGGVEKACAARGRGL